MFVVSETNAGASRSRYLSFSEMALRFVSHFPIIFSGRRGSTNMSIGWCDCGKAMNAIRHVRITI